MSNTLLLCSFCYRVDNSLNTDDNPVLTLGTFESHWNNEEMVLNDINGSLFILFLPVETSNSYTSPMDIYSPSSYTFSGNLDNSPSYEQEYYNEMYSDDRVLDSFNFDIAMIRAQLENLPALPHTSESTPAMQSRSNLTKSWREVVGGGHAPPSNLYPTETLTESSAELFSELSEYQEEPKPKEVCRYWLNVLLQWSV